MGKYVTRSATEEEYQKIVSALRSGYIGKDGIKRKPDERTAAVIVVEANLGCRLGDVLNLTHESFELEDGIYKLNIIEEKTKKKRCFVVPENVIEFIDDYACKHPNNSGKIFAGTKSTVQKSIKHVCDYLGYHHIASHSFRKMAASRLYEKSGYDIQLVSQFLQHANVATTQRYIKRSPRRLEQAITQSAVII